MSLDEVPFAVFRNLHRRHLNGCQEAVVAVRITDLRHRVLADQSGQLAGVTQANTAEMAERGERSVRRAREVKRAMVTSRIAPLELDRPSDISPIGGVSAGWLK